MADPIKNKDRYSELETERRAEAALKRMLNTPHTKHAPLKAKPNPSRPKASTRKPSKRA